MAIDESRIEEVTLLRDKLLGQVVSDADIFTERNMSTTLPGFNAEPTFFAKIKTLQNRSEHLERLRTQVRVLRRDYVAAYHAAREKTPTLTLEGAVEALAASDKSRKDLAAAERVLNRQIQCEALEISAFLFDTALPLLVENGILPSQDWPSGVSSIASALSHSPINDTVYQDRFDQEQENKRLSHTAKIERTRGLLAQLEHAVSGRNLDFQTEMINYLFARPDRSAEDFKAHYEQIQKTTLEEQRRQDLVDLDRIRDLYEQRRVDAEADGVVNVPFRETYFAEKGDVIDSGGKRTADKWDKKVVRRCEYIAIAIIRILMR